MRLIVIGTTVPAGLEGADCTVLAEVVGSHFDSATEMWTVITPDGTRVVAPVVIDTRPSADPAVATHGIPNFFRLPVPHRGRQLRYVLRCLRLLERTGAARIEARGRIVLRRGPGRPIASRFYLSGSEPEPDDLYDGPATLKVDGHEVTGRVRLIGHLDAIDGRYHWQGTVFDSLPGDARARAAGVTLTIERTAAARVVEATPWGTYMISGVGDPPFPL